MPLPKAPVAKGSVLTDIPAELPTQAPAPTAARALSLIHISEPTRPY